MAFKYVLVNHSILIRTSSSAL